MAASRGCYGHEPYSAHTTPAPAPFNANFYIAAATVIPVLFLAVAVQARTYENLLKATRAATKRSMGSGPLLKRVTAYVTSLKLAGLLLAGVILIEGALSEALAMYAPYRQRDPANPGAVLDAVVFLIIVAAAGPALALLREVIDVPISAIREGLRRRLRQADGQPGAQQGSSPALESDKTYAED